jgi:undecaprenyl diphosphate synthase
VPLCLKAARDFGVWPTRHILSRAYYLANTTYLVTHPIHAHAPPAQHTTVVQVRINILGDISTLPPELQRVVGRVVTMSRSNTRLVLNVALAYTSRHEMAEAAKCVARGVATGELLER